MEPIRWAKTLSEISRGKPFSAQVRASFPHLPATAPALLQEHDAPHRVFNSSMTSTVAHGQLACGGRSVLPSEDHIDA
jgi:hypothetical protein